MHIWPYNSLAWGLKLADAIKPQLLHMTHEGPARFTSLSYRCFLLHFFTIPLLYLAHFSFTTQFRAFFPWETFPHPFLCHLHPLCIKHLTLVAWKSTAYAMELKLGPCIPFCPPDRVLMPVVESPCCSSQHPPVVPDTWQVFRNFWSVWSELPDSPGCVRAHAWWGVGGVYARYSRKLKQVRREQLNGEGGECI